MEDTTPSSSEVVTASTSSACLFEELFKSGAISADERNALLETAGFDAAKDNAADDARYHKYPFIPRSSNIEETSMNTKAIIQSIELNRSIMEAQYEELSRTAPKFSPVSFGNNDTEANVSSLLNAAVRGHLQGAADSLFAIAEVEANIRARAGGNPPTVKPGNRNPEVIDVEAVIVDMKET